MLFVHFIQNGQNLKNSQTLKIINYNNMELGKRPIKSTYTPRSSKKAKYDSSIKVTRVYYSATFDLYNFSDTMVLKLINQRFPNCYLIVGIENEQEKCIMTLQEREEALKQSNSVRQILSPAPKVDFTFLETFQIDFLCSTPDVCDIYSDLNLNEGLVTIVPPVNLTKNDLIARVLSNKDQFLIRCLKKGFNRKNFDVSLFKQISLKLISFKTHTWPGFKFFSEFTRRSRKFFRKIGKKIEFLESRITEALVGNIDD